MFTHPINTIKHDILFNWCHLNNNEDGLLEDFYYTPFRVSLSVIQSVRQKDKIIECNAKCDINYNIVSVGFLCFFGGDFVQSNIKCKLKSVTIIC